MKNKKTQTITFTAVIAAAFFVVNTVFSAISFGAIQVRVANVFYQLVPYNKRYYPALILGVFLANLASPLGWYDLVFGVGTTVLGLGASILINNHLSKLLHRQIATAILVSLATILVAIELHLVLGLPVAVTWLTVMAGQFASQVLGIIVMRIISKRMDLSK